MVFAPEESACFTMLSPLLRLIASLRTSGDATSAQDTSLRNYSDCIFVKFYGLCRAKLDTVGTSAALSIIDVDLLIYLFFTFYCSGSIHLYLT